MAQSSENGDSGVDPEVRVDQLTGMRVLVAPGRSDRPKGMDVPDREITGSEGCPFCEGNESSTPDEFYALRPDGGEENSPGWVVRSVPNLFPALVSDDDGPAQGGGAQSGGNTPIAGAFSSPADPLHASAKATETDLFVSRPASGTHEVIISSPEHSYSLGQLSEERISVLLDAWRQRMSAYPDAQYVQLIVNEDRAAGASLEHSHAQMYALDFVPAAVARERERANAYTERTGGSNLLVDVLVEEIRRDARLITIDDDAALICPWASRMPYEMRIIPRRAAASFTEDTAGAGMLATAYRVLEARFGRVPPLNMWIRTAPRGVEHFQWHIDISPRLQTPAGFELATDIYINSLSPELSAAELRDCL